MDYSLINSIGPFFVMLLIYLVFFFLFYRSARKHPLNRAALILGIAAGTVISVGSFAEEGISSVLQGFLVWGPLVYCIIEKIFREK